MSGDEVYIKQYEKFIDNIVKSSKYGNDLYSFAQYILINGKSYPTAYNYVRYVNNILNESNKAPKDLTLSDYVNFLAKYKLKTSSYQINLYTALKWFSKYLMANKINMDNPMQYIQRPEMKESRKTIIRRSKKTMNKDQLVSLVEATDNLQDKIICILLTHTGMRCKGLWKLDVSDIDFKKKKIVTVDKGDKIQEYFLDDDTIRYLKMWIVKRNELLNGNTNESALFISNHKTRMSRQTIYNRICMYGNQIGMHLTPHVIRSGAITAVYEATRDVFLAQQFAGHSSEKTTELYIRSKDNNARKEGARIISNIFSGSN